ncbi:mannonate dehydratase [Massilibacteroides sp.]|uniref:mannonate dehydratase n=1 Tax=Massilibacteroides sp. TaxID=2034766 RepID=UPI00262F460C|nr:mannonate dehydratase [Massilibacteroides sp.]MDD4515838.1 mannonate dehydratase [Massilibacteroides sp.]
MALEKTWRWFGRKDTVSLAELKQMGVEGVVTALHDIPPGEVWPVEEIRKVRQEIESYGMRWSVVESLPVSEGIKICSADRPKLIANYIASLRNLAKEGVDTVCYNFMPVLDWARTDLHYKEAKGGESMLFDYPTFAAFDIFLLKRENAEKEYPDSIIEKAKRLLDKMSPEQQEELAHNIIVVTQAFIHGVLGDDSTNYIERFRSYLNTYKEINSDKLREHLVRFLQDVVPVAEEEGINLCIHPDDPPFPLLGLPRIASTQEDFRWILQQVDSVANGVTFCTGSLSGCRNNDIVAMVKEFAPRIHFVHLRNTAHLEYGSFYESGHLTGDVDIFTVVKVLLEEQIRRKKEGRKDIRMPFRPDHGIRILDDYNRKANPGYPLVGRLKGLAEIDGLQTGIEKMLTLK